MIQKRGRNVRDIAAALCLSLLTFTIYHPEPSGAPPTTTPASTMESSQPPRRTVALEPRTEFRFETDDGASVSITLVAGAAEVFGAEMVMNRSYSFTDAQQVALPRPFWLSP